MNGWQMFKMQKRDPAVLLLLHNYHHARVKKKLVKVWKIEVHLPLK